MKHETQKEDRQMLSSLSNKKKCLFPLKCRFCLKEDKEEQPHLIHIQVDVNILKEWIKHLGGGGCANFRFAQAFFFELQESII